MKYIIVHFVNGKKIIYKTNISQDEVNSIAADIKRLREWMNEIDYCSMVRENILDFLQDAERNGSGEIDNFVRLNRFMMNWLCTFYAWIEYHERHHKEIFSTLKKKYYDNYFEYRFSYALRKFTTHQALCINKMKFDVLKELTTFQIEIENILLYKNELKMDIRNELEKMMETTTYIDAVDFTCRFISVFEQMQGELWESLQRSYTAKVGDILKLTQDNPTLIVESYICDQEEKFVMPIGSAVNRFLWKAEKMLIPEELSPYIKR